MDNKITNGQAERAEAIMLSYKKPTSHQRLSVVEIVYHQITGQQPSCTDSRFSRTLETDEQVWIRRMVIDSSHWHPIDAGWLTGKRVGMLLLKNDEPQGSRTVVAVSSSHGSPETAWLLLPGETLRGVPYRPADFKLRCVSGRATCLVTLIPA